MAQELPANVKVLRLFGADPNAVENALRSAHDKEQVVTQSMHKGSETLVLLETRMDSDQANKLALERWVRRLKAACGGALYGEGDTNLTEAAVKALTKHKKLFVSADASTGVLLEQRLETVAGAEAVYDFGSESYANEKIGPKLAAAGRNKKQAGSETAQAAARIRLAYRLSGADWAVAYVPVGNGESWLLVGDKKGYWLRRIPATEKPALWLLDMLRRAARQLGQAPGTVWLRYGEPLPDQAAGSASAPQEGLADQELLQRQQHSFAPAPEPDPEEEEEARAAATQPARAPVRRGLLALIIVAVIVLAAAGLLWLYTGGNIASFWQRSGLQQFNVSNAAFLLVGGRL